MIIGGSQRSEEIEEAELPERSTLGGAYRILGAFAGIGAVAAIILGSLNGNTSAIIAGAGGILFAIMLFGLGQFFEQIARITAATEETARRLRDLQRTG
jgi:hypothetical protein